MVESAPREIKTLQNLGVVFDNALALEGGHSQSRILFCKDSTGAAVINTLAARVRERENITMHENAHLLELIKKGGFFAANIDNEYYSANNVILAAGGIGGIYSYTTNSPVSTGSGIYFAYKLGAKIKDISLVQFHPTAFAGEESRERFLISEAVRGEGARLLNYKHERFTDELAPRDIVSKCILSEQKRTGSNKFYLDISHRDGEFIKSRFPNIYEKLLSCGYDMTREPVPVCPCQHYVMGGVEINSFGETSVGDLYAAGECSRTGVHGNNRLASNSLTETLVFSRRTAEHINQNIKTESFILPEMQVKSGTDAPDFRAEIQGIMQKCYFVLPDFEEIRKNLPRVKEIMQTLESDDYAPSPELTDARAIATTAYLILKELFENQDD